MCGISGIISSNIPSKERDAMVTRMNGLIAHRGPDNEGLYSDQQVTLGHRRLSIIDLSAQGNQPFFSSDGRYAVVYNGELYNYRELKLDLQRAAKGSGHTAYFFKTDSDTEVLLAAYLRWGKKCMDRFKGMFAFAIYDSETGVTFIARDRLGVKPLYYYYGEKGLFFASEIRAIIGSGVRRFRINRSKVAEYAMYQTVFAPDTMVEGVKMLMPGHYMEVTSDKVEIGAYYQPSIKSQEDLSYKETCNKVFELLHASVSRRMVADVPFGAFLSGGIDSSAIVALMSGISGSRINTFTVTFEEAEFSEARYARQVAEKFNTHHHELFLRPSDFLAQVPEALAAMDHPCGDGPNTYVVSKATRKAGITMALSGIGGDELFAGYAVFKQMQQLASRSWLNHVPRPVRKAGASLMQMRRKDVAAAKIAETLSQPSINFENSYPLVRSLFTSKKASQLVDGNPYSSIKAIVAGVPQVKDHLLSAVSIAELHTYLQNVLLRDTDQMSMAVALEVREPFLDHELVEFVLGLPDSSKTPVTPKKLLVDAMGDLLPSEIVNRPKMGFTLPWKHWLKNELRDYCYLNLQSLDKKGLFRSGSVIRLWEQFINGDPMVSWSRVWHLVVLNDWMERNQVEV